MESDIGFHLHVDLFSRIAISSGLDPLPLTPNPSLVSSSSLPIRQKNASRIVGSDRDVSRDSAKENHGDSDQSCNTFLHCDLLISHLHGSGKRKWKWMRLVIDFIGNVRGILTISTHCTEMLTCLFWPDTVFRDYSLSFQKCNTDV